MRSNRIVMVNSQPILSIITVTFNAANEIEQTIASTIEKKGPDTEFIIIDGGSTDSTLDIIKKYETDITFWTSENDNGIYDAMNKGIVKSKGAYLYFINAGDVLLDIPYGHLRSSFQSDVKLLSFPVLDSTNKVRFPTLSSWFKIKNLLPHQGCFYKRDDDISYDLKYRVFADFDLNQKLYLKKKRIQVLRSPIVASHDLGGISHDKRFGKEIFEVVGNNLGFFFKMLSFIYFKFDGLKTRFKKGLL